MKKIFILIFLIALTFSSFAQNVLSITTTIPISCNGGTATIFITTDASSNFNYQLQVQLPPPASSWVNAGVVTTVAPPPTFTIPGLTASSYRVILIDISSGLSTDTFEYTVNQPQPISVYNISTENVSCNGFSDGEIDLITGGGSPPLTYNWSNGLPNSPTHTGLSAGTYTCSITDANGCTYSGNPLSITITQPAFPLTASIQQTQVSCFGYSDGIATITNPNGGTPGYSYSWNTNPIVVGQSATGLLAGFYTCTITDASGCQITRSITVTQPSFLSASITGTSNFNGFGVSCNGGNNGTATASHNGGGTPGYTFSWNTIPVQTTALATGLVAGTYSCTVTDANGCQATTSTVTITQPPAFSATNTTSDFNGFGVSCNGDSNGSATAVGSGGVAGYTFSWNTIPVQTTALATGLGAGTYICTVTDANGCPAITQAVITEPILLTATNTTSDFNGFGVSCYGDSNGSATAVGVNGVSGYTFSWNTIPVQTTAQATGLGQGTYICTVTDANGCQAITTAVITEPDEINFSITAPMISCMNGSDGTATVNILSGGAFPYTFSWNTNPIQTGQSATGLVAGTYICTITDANGCTKIATAIVTEPPSSLILTPDSVAASCNGGNDGSASVVASGGFPSYTYLWSNGDPTSSISTLFAGTYTCTVTDANNCIVSEDIIVDQPDPIIPNVTATDVFCNGGSNGTATANPTGGTGPYTFEWSDAPTYSTTSTVTGLSAISYTVEVIDALNCPPVTETILINEPNIIDDGENISNVSCNNGNDGSVDLTVSGGNGNYIFSWSDGQITEDAINLSAATYSVVITDALGCSSTFSYQITEPLYPLEGVPTVTDVLCFGESTGSITVSPQGGTLPYSCFWPFNGQTTFTLYQTLPIGTYTATVTDANGCVAYATGTIDQPDDFTITTSAIPASCFGYNDGSAVATPDGGILPYTYNWSNGQSGQNATMLSSGAYMVTAFDNNGCPDVANIFVSQPTQITASISTIDILCNGAETGVITVNTTNGSAGPPYIYSWSNGHNDPINQSLGAGTYYLTITDGDGCFSTFVETLVEPTIINASLSFSNISVNGANDGTISANVSGGTPTYSYSWSGPNNFSSSSSVINGLSAGIYTLVVQDDNGCQQTFNQIINEPNCNVNIDSTFIIPLCFGDMGMLSWQNSGGLAPYSNTLVNSYGNVIVNGAQYDYPPSPLQLPAGVYDLIVTDAAGCNAILNVPITTPDSITIDLTLTDALCYGSSDGTATAVISGGTQPYNNIDWGAVNPNLLIAGDYNVMVTDVNGCTSDVINFTIDEPTQLQIDSVITTLVSCVPGNDGTATTYASGGVFPYTYYWSNGQANQMANSLVSGTYIAYVFDANNCMADSTGITITNAPGIDIDITETPISCNGGNDGELIAILLSGSYPLTYSWWDLSSPTPSVVISSDSIISNLSSGGYQLLATDINGCFDQETVSVINPSSITFNLVPFNISSNGAVDGIINTTLISGGQAPYSFFWIGPNGFTSISQNLTNLNTGTYTLTITDANGCETVQSTVINEPGCNVSISLNTTQPLCFNYSGNITWTNSGGSPSYYNVITDLNIPLQVDDSYSSSGTYSLPAGNYALQVTDQYGCSDLENIEIIEPEILLGNYITSETSCFGGSDGTISVSPTGGTSPYFINYGGLNPNLLSAGVYSFILTDNNGCPSAPALISYQISEPDDIVVSLSSTTPVDCFGGSNGTATVTAVGGTMPYSYSWSPSGDNTSTADNLSSGTHYVTITDANGCSPSSGSFAVNITQPTLALIATITPINISCYGENDGSATVNPTGGTAPYSYFWSNGQITNQINTLVAGTYSCIITDANKCNYTVWVTIDQPDEIIANLSVTNITCNGDVDGSAIVNPTGGIGPYSFLWYDNTTINSVSNLQVGSYTVTITDNTSCSIPLTFDVTQPDDLTLVASELNGTSCNGGSNGIATVGVNGGTPFYTYTWLDSLNNLVSTDSFALNLSEATYSVIVIDDNGCIDSTNVIITSPLEISVNVAVDSTLCNGSSDGSATAIPTGGTGPYTYLWSGGQSIGYNATYSSLDALTTYYLTVTDFNNCVSAGNPVNIPEPNPILYTFSSIDQNGFNVSCNDSSDATITTHATGGNSPYQYSSNNILFTNDSTFIDLPSGWLSVYIIDDYGCTATDSVEVTEPDALDPNINIITSVTCSGGNNGELASIVQGGVGGFFYTWSNSTLGVLNQGLSEGTYSVVVTDANGCIGIDSITLVADFDIVTNSSTIPISCTGFNDGVAEMQPTGGTAPYTFSWNTIPVQTTPLATGLGAGTYICTVTDANGCSTTDTVSIIESSTSLEIISSQVLHVTCNGGADGSATINATGGTGGPYSYQWDDINLQTTQVAAGLNADTFIVSVTDLAFCTVYDTIIVNEPAPIYADINHFDISCYGFFDGILSATVSGGINPYSLSWSGPNSYSSNLDSISDLGLGEYILSITDNNGCPLLDTSVILEPSPLTYVKSVTHPSCFAISDGEVSLVISGGNMPYSAVYAGVSASYPTNDSAIISNLSAGSDTLYVYDANGCENFTFVNLINPLELSVDNINITNATCFDYSDGSVSVSVLGGTSPYSYQLSDDLGAIISTTAATLGLIAGTYEYQIIDINNCVATAMVIVEEPDEIEIIQEISCYGSILVDVLNTLGDYQIFWEGDISDSIFINDLSAGQYIVTVIDDIGCVKVDSFEVNELINYSIFDASCLTIPDGVIEIFDIYSGNAPYSLSLNNSLLDDDVVSTYNIDNLLAGSYLVTLVDADSCSFSDSLLVDYIGGYDCINEPIIISPNSDGTNDNWHPIYDIDTEMEVIILNRWGEREFYYSGNSLVFEWDGLSTNGNKLPSTDYYYIIKFKDNNYPDRTGVITLIR